MKSRFKLFPIFLSIMIVFLSIFQYSITAYASGGSYGGGGHMRDDGSFWYTQDKVYDSFGDFISNEADKLIAYGISVVKAVSDGDFVKYIQNDAAFQDYFNPSHIIYSDDIDGNGTEGIVFSDELTVYMKQALLEYAEEANGFTLMHTINYNSIPPSMFTHAGASSYMYNTFRALVMENGCIAVYTTSFSTASLSVCRPFHDSDDPVAFVKKGKNADGISILVDIYDACTWQKVFFPIKAFTTLISGTGTYRIYNSWDDVGDISRNTKSTDNFFVYENISTYWGGNFGKGYYLFSTDGRKVKVFNSVDAMKNYTAGYRSVYFGSGFYEDPGEIKVSFDDLEKYLDGKYDDFFKDLKDLIGKETDNEDDLSEEDLEKLVDKILDKMDESGNDDPGNNTGDNSGLLQSMLSTISGYLDDILMYLESILTDLDYIVLQMQDMTEEEVNDKSDSVISEFTGAFSEIADMMSRKFPFSIPWDIKNLYVALSGGKEPGIQTLADDIGIEDFFDSDTSPPRSGGRLVDVVVYPSPSRSSPAADGYGIMPLVADEDMGNISPVPPSGGVSPSDTGAPVFKIPLVIKSAGINSALLIDMSNFDTVSEISRTTFLLIFLYQLFLLSMRVFEFVRSFMG